MRMTKALRAQPNIRNTVLSTPHQFHGITASDVLCLGNCILHVAVVVFVGPLSWLDPRSKFHMSVSFYKKARRKIIAKSRMTFMLCKLFFLVVTSLPDRQVYTSQGFMYCTTFSVLHGDSKSLRDGEWQQLFQVIRRLKATQPIVP